MRDTRSLDYGSHGCLYFLRKSKVRSRMQGVLLGIDVFELVYPAEARDLRAFFCGMWFRF